ncbi:MAG TPA: DUF4870 domain-containing protein [Pirellulales bacterium]|nr:DUF4870 domain-containing protein [Pirellulales bacterium]
MDEQTNPYDAPQTPIEPPASVSTADRDARMWGMLCHLSALSMYVSGIGFIVGPLIVWLVKKDDHPFIDDQGKESLNFEISILIYYIVSTIAIFCVIGIPLLVILHFFHIVMIIVAAVRANGGETYRYPLTIRLIK